MPTVLTEAEIDEALRDLPAWAFDSGALRRTAELADFPTAIRAVDDIAVVAEEMDHHPDIDIRWRTLVLTCSTHSAGGVTENDLALARKIDEIVESKPVPA